MDGSESNFLLDEAAFESAVKSNKCKFVIVHYIIFAWPL